MTIYTLSIVGALFRYMKRWNISLQSGQIGKRWKHAAQRSAAMHLMRERASANGIPSSDRIQVKGPTACAYAGAKPSAVAELPNT